MSTGQSFGELAFFSMNYEPSASARSVQSSVVFRISLGDFMETIEEFENDKERFCNLRDRLVLNREYCNLNISCYSCKKSSHTIKECPYLFFNKSLDSILMKHNKEIEEKIKSFRRREKRREYIFDVNKYIYNNNSNSNSNSNSNINNSI